MEVLHVFERLDQVKLTPVFYGKNCSNKLFLFEFVVGQYGTTVTTVQVSWQARYHFVSSTVIANFCTALVLVPSSLVFFVYTAKLSVTLFWSIIKLLKKKNG